MKANSSNIITGAAILGVCCLVATLLVIGKYSTSRHINKRFQEVAQPTFQPGDDVFLRPGKVPAVVIYCGEYTADVCVKDTTGGVKIQTVPPLILEPKNRW